jgi:hypothetical protein
MANPTPAKLWEKLSPAMRRAAADGLAIAHRFKPEPRLKHGKPHYEGRTVEQLAHYQGKAKG